jgi:hypothetical protein
MKYLLALGCFTALVLVAIHGVGDQYQQNTVLNNTSRLNNKIGCNREIPVRWLVQKAIPIKRL